MLANRFLVPVILLALVVMLIACGGGDEPAAPPPPPVFPTDTPAAVMEAPGPTMASTVMAAATAAPAPTEAMAATEATEAPAPTDVVGDPSTAVPAMPVGLVVFTLGEGTIARYKVEEVLANTGFKVAMGETTDVAGSIAVDAGGAVVAEESRIAVQAATLKTDSNRRDGYVRSRTLETDTYPEVVFRPTAFDGLPDAPVPGLIEFTITGDLTVKDQTREMTWNGMAEIGADGMVTGSASVQFTFDDFGMDKPSVAIVLSVEDEILLELDFVGTITVQ